MSAGVETSTQPHAASLQQDYCNGEEMSENNDSQDSLTDEQTNYATMDISNAEQLASGSVKSLYSNADEDEMNGDSEELHENGIDSKRRMMYHMGLHSPVSGNSLTSNLADSTIHDMAALSRHTRIGLLRNEGLSPETSKLLREILQAKDKRLHQKLVNGGASELVGNGTDSSLVTKLLQHEGSFVRNGSLDTDLGSPRSIASGEASSDESDQECKMGQYVEDDDGNSAINGGKRKVGDDSMNYDRSQDDFNNETGNSDPVKAKRARVENIITHMRLSPYRATNDAASNALSEPRRQKRKQYTPIQHDSSVSEPSSPKYKRVEKDTLRKQLKIMQEQLSEMQQRYLQLFEKEHPDMSDLSDASDSENKNQNEEDKNNSKLNTQTVEEASVENGREAQRKNFSGLNSEQPNLHASQRNIDTKCRNKDEHYGKHSSHRISIPSEFKNLASTLKAEITNSVGSVVDNIVSRFMENQKQKRERVSFFHPEPMKELEKLKKLSQEHLERMCSHKLGHTKVTDKMPPPLMDIQPQPKSFGDIHTHHGHLFAPPPYFTSTPVPPPHHPSMYAPLKEPEQTEALALVVAAPKKKRTKVTDTRLSPRAARALLQDGSSAAPVSDTDSVKHSPMATHDPYHRSLVPATLPTTVAIPNPSLQHSDVLAMYSHGDHTVSYNGEGTRSTTHSPSTADHGSPNIAQTPTEGLPLSFMKSEMESFEQHFHHHQGESHSPFDGAQTTTLTPMHLRKAKLMFFFCRYPSSAIIKAYFPDVKFNKNNTAQLVKWFSNFREFYYIQMEKYARQALAEGVTNPDAIAVSIDSEIYRVLNLHYNRNNQIEVPDNFRGVIQATLREFFKAIMAGKDNEQSWKKAIYKIIARMDDQLPEFFKMSNWMEQLNDV